MLGAPLFNNRLILAGILAEIVLIPLIVYTPWGNRIFGTQPIGMAVWLFVMTIAPLMALFEALRRGLYRAFRVP